jgi:hypothetical protein
MKEMLKVDGCSERAKLVLGYKELDQAFMAQWRTHFKNSTGKASSDRSGSR